MKKIEVEYFLEKVEHIRKSTIVLNTSSLKDAIVQIKKINLKSKKEVYKENQWFPYARLTAVKPSGKLKFLDFNSEQLLKLNIGES